MRVRGMFVEVTDRTDSVRFEGLIPNVVNLHSRAMVDSECCAVRNIFVINRVRRIHCTHTDTYCYHGRWGLRSSGFIAVVAPQRRKTK